MTMDTQALVFLKETTGHLEQIEQLQRRMLTLGEEQLEVDRRQLEAQDTQNVLAWLQLQQAQGHTPDPTLVDLVRRRLRV
ncbi:MULTISPECIES: hypothetical protein [Paenarthrobacter]|uniref:Uncharacterized protein n=1 Tax=Paenarthrobacter ureafaciens TaxID=37931 RepID=A0AAX3EDC4_PAEUR|nr:MULTISPECIES: hypothetical protein [Paenarthrobacter]NKR13253.1 hypothetical protein [Arthrobacter sp. M5]NKR14897.1 hypothetical protein [Arthrobacter sp. M6]OEH62449.1 hypothetical protein A5N13_01975 [Arthrobacter sp. D4]OEH63020.1 hypothetical protein A5N17_10215 [Arthrobacter sp. D2]MDO5865200.1 hypothetical protein [Paenarthrobacter sp. SD-2]